MFLIKKKEVFVVIIINSFCYLNKEWSKPIEVDPSIFAKDKDYVNIQKNEIDW